MSVTALAEYADMMFTRASLALGDRRWWIELRPAVEGGIDPKGFVALRANVDGPAGRRKLEHIASMNAIENNMAVKLEDMERVIEYYLSEFMKQVEAVERGEEIIKEQT